MALTEEQKKKLREAAIENRKKQISTVSISPLERLQQLQRAQAAPKIDRGFLSGLRGIGRDIAETGKQVFDTGKETVSEIGQTFKDVAKGEIAPTTAALEAVGKTVSGIGEAVGETIIGAGKVVLPKSIEEQISQEAKDLLNTEIGQQALQAYQSGEEEFSKFKENYPNVGRSLEGILQIAGGAIELTGAGVGAKVGKKVVGALEEIPTMVGAKTKLAKQVAKDVIPTKERIVNFQVTRALDLTQDDVKNIKNSTGNEVGEWLANKNLIKQNKEETLQAVDEYFGAQYKNVRDVINSIEDTYDPTDVPSYRASLQLVKNQTEGLPGYEVANSIIDNLLTRQKIKLSDIQETKELIDDTFKLYKITGDIAEGRSKESVRRLRNDLREFIEKEAKQKRNVDIQNLNNEVATSRSIVEAIGDRSTRGLTRSNITIGDLTAFGAGGALFSSPLVGAAFVFAKKVLGSPAIRLRFAKWLDELNDAKKIEVYETLKRGRIPKGMPKELKDIAKTIPEAAGATIGLGVTTNLLTPEQE